MKTQSDIGLRRDDLTARLEVAQARLNERMRERKEADTSPSIWHLLNEASRVDEKTFKDILSSENSCVRNVEYQPRKLSSDFVPSRHRVKNKNFERCSLKDTSVTDFEFHKCEFRNCVFIGTVFENCRFTSCSFINCNFYRFELKNCFADPIQFLESTPISGNENVGLHLYHELLQNSRQQVQPDHVNTSLFHFRKWQRYLKLSEIRRSRGFFRNLRDFGRYIGLLLLDLATGSGTKLGRLFLSVLLSLLLFAKFNLMLAEDFGIGEDEKIITDYSDALYISVVIMTNLGFGNVTLAEGLGRLFVSFQAIVGLVFFATLTSLFFKRVTS